jgi:hypothetical protein
VESLGWSTPAAASCHAPPPTTLSAVWALGTAQNAWLSPLAKGLTGLAGVSTRPAGYPTREVPPAAERAPPLTNARLRRPRCRPSSRLASGRWCIGCMTCWAAPACQSTRHLRGRRSVRARACSLSIASTCRNNMHYTAIYRMHAADPVYLDAAPAADPTGFRSRSRGHAEPRGATACAWHVYHPPRVRR